MHVHEIRQSFSDFFANRGHERVASSSLVPADDPTLLFTNAGMVQFKRVFQGLEARDYNRAVTVQKCVRAGGKHNDLEEVGHTARHHTFFEMLGNFSFGDYFKRDAIAFAWEWVTSEEFLGISPDRLYFTVHHTDDEAAKLWHEVTGVDVSRIYRLGDKDNFWQMGDTGPCGPCSEIFVDIRSGAGSGGTLAQSEFEALGESGELLEIWNLVFMQFDQAPDGSRTPLPAPSVDTGAGLERIGAVMQGVPSNFDTDAFMEIISRAEEIVGRPYDKGPEGAGYRVLADHARAVAFLLADGVYPSNDGRGYVLRRILRRAVRHAYLLGRSEPTLDKLAEVVIDQLGGVYPELRAKRSEIVDHTRAEERRFLETIADGLRRMDDLTAGSPGTIAGSDAFKLYDTFGFPIDLTQVIASERGWNVDVAGFEDALSVQQDRSRSARRETGGGGVAGASASAGPWTTVTPGKQQRFVGYDQTEAETEILQYRGEGEAFELLLHENPFYAESGGQVSDTGSVDGPGWNVDVTDVRKDDGRQVLVGRAPEGFEPGVVQARVDAPRRRDIERNHTATHLVHAALRAVLGPHVRQAGSVVDPGRLRFDFAHHEPMTPEQLREVEKIVNEGVWANVPVETYELPYKEALARGAMALFGEKYGDIVRVVDVPDISVELCGGTHVRSTGQIGLFHFTGESGVAAGVRRIEAVTGPGAYQRIRTIEARLDEAADSLHTNPEHLARKIDGLLEERRRLERQIEDLLRSGAGGGESGDEIVLGDIRLFVDESPVPDRDGVGLIMDAFRDQHKSAIKVLFATGERPGVHVAVTDDLVSAGVKAGDLARRIAEVSGGKGGGRPHFASAGVGDPALLGTTREQTPDIVREILGASNHGT